MTEIQTQRDTFKSLKVILQKPGAKNDLEEALRGMIPIDYFVRCALTTLQGNEALLKCSAASILTGMMEAATMGLEIDGVLGHGYLIPYGKEKPQAKFIPGYKGFLALALRNGAVKKIQAHVVYEKDTFRLERGSADNLVHTPFLDGDRGEITHIYAIAWLASGEVIYEWESTGGINITRDSVLDPLPDWKAAKSPWTTHWSAMARKTMVRSLFKWLPLEATAQRAASLDEQVDAGVEPRAAESEDVTQTDGGTDGLMELLDKPSETKDETEPEQTRADESEGAAASASEGAAEPPPSEEDGPMFGEG